MIKTVTLTANSELAVELHGGCHCCIENRGDSVIYASKLANVVPDADGVIAIDSGSAKILRNVARYEKNNDTYDYCGKIYLLSDSNGKVEIQTASDLCFFKSDSKGGGDVKSNSSYIYQQQQNPDKDGLWIVTDTPRQVLFSNEAEFLNKNSQIITSDISDYKTPVTAVNVNGEIYLFGADNSKAVQIFDIKSRKLTTKSAVLPYYQYSNSTSNVTAFRSCNIGDICYLCSGNYGGVGSVSYLYKYDTITDTVTKVGNFSSSKREISICAIGEIIYSFGGYGNPGGGFADCVNSIFAYDTETNISTKLSAVLRAVLSNMASCAVGNICFLFGGRTATKSSGTETLVKYIQKFDTETGVITNCSNLPTASKNLVTFLQENKIYIVYPTGTVLIYDTLTDTITTAAFSLSEAITGTCSVTCDDKGFIFSTDVHAFSMFEFPPDTYIVQTDSLSTGVMTKISENTYSKIQNVYSGYNQQVAAYSINNGVSTKICGEN